MAPVADPEEEALRHKTLAESKYNNSNLKSALKHAERAHKLCPSLEGISSMHTAFQILSVASKSSVGTDPDWYKVLQVEPFSNINTIKKQFKKLALVLHPDKNPYLGCEEAFKLVNEGVRVFSDKIKRKEYDMKLRIKIQEERVNESEGDGAQVETFWTACSRCRLLHKFERKYLGHNLVCPSCKKSFEAVEVGGSGEEESKEEDQRWVRVRSERLKRKMDDSERLNGMNLRGKKGSGESVVLKGKVGSGETGGPKGKGILNEHKGGNEKRASRGLMEKIRDGDLKEKGSGEMGGNEWGGGRLRRRTSTVGDVLARSKANTVEDGEIEKSSKLKKVDVGEETMTLAQMQLEMKRKMNQRKEGLKPKEREKDEGEKENKRSRRGALMDKILENEKQGNLENGNDEEMEEQGSSESSWNSETSKESVELEVESGRGGKKNGTLENTRQRTSRTKVDLEIARSSGSLSRDLEIMAMEDSNFYNFNKDRVEKSFKKGQVWVIYDDDGMPRHYGLIDEVVSVNPFEVKVSWLDLQNNGDERLICLEKMKCSISCGKFKVSRNTSIHPLNIFSHVMECERAAKELYRIYPKKGSVWALYDEAAFSTERGNLSAGDKRCYHIVVSLTTYTEIHGLSMACLEKVDGFKTIFKRQEIGCHAIRWLEKDGLRLFSHQIPARKLSSANAPDHLKHCWELDPTSLPYDLLTTGWK
ncbi:hypothetical protein SLEP1_g9162 [Rubroshorea leprosula]|uniref:J domain-containing protein n=1 Tax=Rubroshorea leprosula TaxID=152421 RepID=A0AAV5I9Z3_9ROSI|nr:hypothetical protein SLEP1_g9162 [Rubroshorea leprosula]